jgi:hypothetical protein
MKLIEHTVKLPAASRFGGFEWIYSLVRRDGAMKFTLSLSARLSFPEQHADANGELASLLQVEGESGSSMLIAPDSTAEMKYLPR